MIKLNDDVRRQALAEVGEWMRGQGLASDRAFAEQCLDEALQQAQEHLDAGLPLRMSGTGNSRIDAMMAGLRATVVDAVDTTHTQLARGALRRIGLSDETINQII